MGGVEGKAATEGADQTGYETFKAILSESLQLVEAAGVAYVLGGSIASNHWGRPAAVGDIDMIVAPPDAKRLLKAFDEAGYETGEKDPQWIYKATKDDLSVDIIFEMEGNLYLDDEMVDRAPMVELHGARFRLITAEDYVVSQALSMKEDTPDYWYNALGVIAKTRLDWDYLIDRASRGPRRVLSLLLFAQSDDLAVPDSVLKRLFEATYGG